MRCVCMCVSMYVGVYVCGCICMWVYMDVGVYGCRYVCMHGVCVCMVL